MSERLPGEAGIAQTDLELRQPFCEQQNQVIDQISPPESYNPNFFSRIRKLAALAVAVTAVGAVLKAPAFEETPAYGANTETAVIGMPFAGKWSTYVHPSSHSYYSAQWATDIYAPPGTEARLKVGNVSGNAAYSISNVAETSCGAGKRVRVNVRVDNVDVGWVQYEHLETDLTNESSIAPGDLLGKTKNWGNLPCYQVSNDSGVHLHVGMRNTEDKYSCWVDHGTQGVQLSEGANLGVLGSTNTDYKQSCTETPGSGSSTSARPISTNSDMNGDGKRDFVTREGDMWTVRSGDGSAIRQGLHLGNAAATPLVGDINGDGMGDFVTYDNGNWLAWNGQYPHNFISQGVNGHGDAGSTPLVGDVDGNGSADFVVFKNGQWDAKTSGGTPITLGLNVSPHNAIPLLGDMNNDGKLDFVSYDNGTWAAWNGNNGNGVIMQGVQFGNPTSIPMVGNVDGLGGADLIFREGNTWYAQQTNEQPISLGVTKGSATSAPFIADINGSGQADFVTWEPSTGEWSAWDATGQNNPASQGVSFGANGKGMAG